MEIRPATVADAPAVSSLILSLRHLLTIRPDGQGAEKFLASLEPGPVAVLLADPRFRYYVLEVDGQLAGAVAIRDNSHLYHLFVARPYQGQGLARRLWEFARADAIARGNPGQFTVNSSVYAEPVYRGFGFVPTSPRQEVDGLAFTPMQLSSA